MKIMNIIPLNTESAVKLCRDCKWYEARSNAEFSRCLAPDHPENKAFGRRLDALALVDPDIKLDPENPFCEIERSSISPERCGKDGRRWETRTDNGEAA